MYQCPFCDKVTARAGGKGGLSSHLQKHHSMTAKEAYLKVKCENVVPVCLCGCGSQTKFVGWDKGFARFVLGHNGDLSYLPAEESAEIREKRAAALTGRPGWSKGLTKDNSEVVRQRSQKTKESWERKVDEGYTSPLKGRTKENDEGLRLASERAREDFASGKRTPWIRGLTKETDPRVANMARSVSKSVREESLRERLDSLKRLSPEEIISRLQERAPQLELISDLTDYVRDTIPSLTVRCRKCGSESPRSLTSALTNRCFVCDPTGSRAEIEIRDFLRDHLPETCQVIHNSRSVVDSNKRLQADIWIPDKKLVVEHNGLYFHSVVHAGKNSHQEKSDLFSEEGIQVIHVFEDEWRDKKDIVKSLLLHKLGLSVMKIGARKCKIEEISFKERKSFFDSNHLEGDVRKVEKSWGLRFEDEIVAAISVRRPFHGSLSNTLEVARFACKTYTHVPGALQKLLAKTEEYCRNSSKQEILTYVDTRHGKGEGYLSAGFALDHVTPPRFWWTNFVNRFNRFKFRADKTRGMSEEQVAEENNVHKIWGCKNLVLRKILT